MSFNFNSFNIKYNADFIWRLFISFCIVLVICNTSNQVFAISTSVGTKSTTSNNSTTPAGGDPFGTQLCKVVGILEGNVAKAVATVGIFVAAVGFLSGKMQWQSIAILSVGIITIFSASTVIKFLSGNATGADSCATT